MWLVDALLWPGQKICDVLGISTEADEGGLARSMFNTFVYLAVGLAFVAVFAV